MKRRERILLAFTEAYLDQLTPEARIAFLTGKLLAVMDENSAADLTFAAIEINKHADALHWSWFAARQQGPIPNDPQPHGVSP
jgi:hypothetical protein